VLSSMREQLAGMVVFIFQPAEEISPGLGKPSGAMAMVRDGVLDDPKIYVVLGQHISNQAPSGAIRYRPGPMLAEHRRVPDPVQGHRRPRREKICQPLTLS
jgi:amidohydrolase